MITFNDKQVYFLRQNPVVDDKACLSHTWSTEPWWMYGFSRNASGPICTGTKSNFFKAIKDKHSDVIKENSTLYFTSFSDYPRFKLNGASFKRCIKPNKANYYVVNNLTPDITEAQNILLLEDTVAYYMIKSGFNNYLERFSSNKHGNYIPTNKNEIIEYLLKHELIYGTDLKVAYNGSMLYGGKDIELLLNNTTMDIITDSELDIEINKNFDVIKEDDLVAIEEMLDSPDETTRGVGLKMLIGYDVGKTPLTIRTILGIRENKLRFLPEWSSVGVQQVLTSIKWYGFGSFPNRMYPITTPCGKKYDGGDNDIKLIRGVYKREANKYLSLCVKTLENIADAANLNITFNVEYNNDKTDSNSGT